MNAIIQAFLNQLALFFLMVVTYAYSHYQEKEEYQKQEPLYPFRNKVDLIIFIVAWFGFGTYFTWQFNYGMWTYPL